MHLATAILAVLWAWEYLLVLSPVSIPTWMQPALVAGCAIGSTHVSAWCLTAAAISGGVAVLHRVLAPSTVPAGVVVRRRTRRLPPL